MRAVGHLYSRWPVKIAILVAWAALLAFGIFGASKMRVEADVNNFVPEGSYLRDWIDVGDKYFQATGESAALYFVSTDDVPIDFSTSATQAAMTAAAADIAAESVVLDASLSSWLAGFQEHQQALGRSATGVRHHDAFDAHRNMRRRVLRRCCPESTTPGYACRFHPCTVVQNQQLQARHDASTRAYSCRAAVTSR
jgi:hypothetical protein